MQQIAFQASLPRVGSTLLQNILGQNPLIHATPTSPLVNLLSSVKTSYTEHLYQGFYGVNKEEWENNYLNFLRGGIMGYLKSISDKPLTIDKSRSWGGNYNFLNLLFPNPKILFLVRDLRSITSSLEKKHRQHPEQDDRIMINSFNEHEDYSTTFKRCKMWFNHVLLEMPLSNLKQCVLDKTYKHYLFIRYEDLCTNPINELKKIYNYLDYPYFNHNLDNISQITFENDNVHGVYGDHNIKPILNLPQEDYKEILGEDTCNWIYNNYKWYFDMFGYSK